MPVLTFFRFFSVSKLKNEMNEWMNERSIFIVLPNVPITSSFWKMAAPMKRENGRPGSRGYQPFLTARLASYKSQIKKVYKPRSLSLKEFVVKFLTMRALTTLSRSLICTLSNQSTFFLSLFKCFIVGCWKKFHQKTFLFRKNKIISTILSIGGASPANCTARVSDRKKINWNSSLCLFFIKKMP